MYAEPFVATVVQSPAVGQAVEDAIRRGVAFRALLDALEQAGTRPYFVGGLVRSALLGIETITRDLDLLVEGPCFPGVPDALEGFEWAPNRHGNPRVRLGREGTVDVFSPATFFDSGPAVEDYVAFVDNTASGWAYRADRGLVTSEGFLRLTRAGRFALVAGRWEAMERYERAVMLARAGRLERRTGLWFEDRALAADPAGYLDALSPLDRLKYGVAATLELWSA